MESLVCLMRRSSLLCVLMLHLFTHPAFGNPTDAFLDEAALYFRELSATQRSLISAMNEHAMRKETFITLTAFRLRSNHPNAHADGAENIQIATQQMREAKSWVDEALVKRAELLTEIAQFFEESPRHFRKKQIVEAFERLTMLIEAESSLLQRMLNFQADSINTQAFGSMWAAPSRPRGQSLQQDLRETREYLERQRSTLAEIIEAPIGRFERPRSLIKHWCSALVRPRSS